MRYSNSRQSSHVTCQNQQSTNMIMSLSAFSIVYIHVYSLYKLHLQRPGCSLLLGLCGQRPCWTGRPFQRPPVDSSSRECVNRYDEASLDSVEDLPSQANQEPAKSILLYKSIATNCIITRTHWLSICDHSIHSDHIMVFELSHDGCLLEELDPVLLP